MDIEKSIKKMLTVMIIWSVIGVVSLPGMIVALTALSGALKWIVAAPCITILGASFYGLPIGWLGYAKKLEQARVVNAVKSGLLTVTDICGVTGHRPKSLPPILQSLMGKRYLTGYKFNADKTALEKINVPAVPAQAVQTADKRPKKCPNCGGVLSREDGVCEYCGLRN